MNIILYRILTLTLIFSNISTTSKEEIITTTNKTNVQDDIKNYKDLIQNFNKNDSLSKEEKNLSSSEEDLGNFIETDLNANLKTDDLKKVEMTDSNHITNIKTELKTGIQNIVNKQTENLQSLSEEEDLEEINNLQKKNLTKKSNDDFESASASNEDLNLDTGKVNQKIESLAVKSNENQIVKSLTNEEILEKNNNLLQNLKNTKKVTLDDNSQEEIIEKVVEKSVTKSVLKSVTKSNEKPALFVAQEVNNNLKGNSKSQDDQLSPLKVAKKEKTKVSKENLVVTNSSQSLEEENNNKLNNAATIQLDLPLKNSETSDEENSELIKSVKSPVNTNYIEESHISNSEINDSKIGNIILENSKTSIQSSDYNIHQGECDKDLLSIFGIIVSDENPEKPVAATARETSYCRRNRHTCCSAKEISSSNLNFSKAAKKMRESFEVFEELVTLFKGPAYKKIILEAEKENKCMDVLKNSKLYNNAENFEKFMEIELPGKIDEIESLVNDTQLYVKKNLWFYGNMICTVCNPSEVSFFKLDAENGSTITSHVSNCAELLEMSEFETRASLAYNDVIQVFVDLVSCKNGWEEGNENLLEKLDMTVIDERTEKFYDCYEKFNFSSPECQDICKSKKINKYEFPIKFFKSVGQALKLLYEELTEKDIEEYYEVVKESNFEEIISDDPITFYQSNSEFEKYGMDKLSWEVDNEEGITLYNDHMGKLYINKLYEGIYSMVVGLFIYVLFW